jgi:hypothetical protein
MRNGDMARFVRMLELSMIALATHADPTFGFESLDDVNAPHFV